MGHFWSASMISADDIFETCYCTGIWYLYFTRGNIWLQTHQIPQKSGLKP